MIIRKIQYNINYSHILTFKEDYKKITSPCFGWNKVKYSIEQGNSIHESLKLIFAEYNTVMHFRKDGITIMFEGNETDFLSDSSLIREFFVMYEQITQLECYSRTTKHDLIIYAVDISKQVSDSDYLKINPCPEKLLEFACVYTYVWKNYDVNITFGDFILNDIEKYELSPFKTNHNKELFSAKFGKMCEVRFLEEEKEPSLSKLKKIIRDANKQIKLF